MNVKLGTLYDISLSIASEAVNYATKLKGKLWAASELLA